MKSEKLTISKVNFYNHGQNIFHYQLTVPFIIRIILTTMLVSGCLMSI